MAANSVSLGPIIDRVYIAAEGGPGSVEIAELAQLAPVSQAQTTCLSDVMCRSSADFAQLAEASRAIGYFRLMKNGKAYQCTGSLLNDAANSGTPYFLTARHCVSTKEEAASVEVTWDQKFEACGSNRIKFGSRSIGAEILVTSSATDVALLKLASVPANRVFLGVETRPLAPGTIVHRITHAGGGPQTYSSGTVEEFYGLSCEAAPRLRYIYTKTHVGATLLFTVQPGRGWFDARVVAAARAVSRSGQRDDAAPGNPLMRRGRQWRIIHEGLLVFRTQIGLQSSTP